jgi:hypothetical protein
MPARRLTHPLEVRHSHIHGKGVFAKGPIAPNALLGVFEGERTKRNGRYVLWVEDEAGEFVGIRGKNELRFLNHSRQANAHFRGAKLFALQAIPAGAEVTFDYGEEWTEFG